MNINFASLKNLFLKGKKKKNKEIFIFILWYPGNIHLFKVNNRNSRKRCETLEKGATYVRN